MKTRYVVITLGCAVALALAVVHVRTQKITLGYRMQELHRELAGHREALRKQNLQMAIDTSAGALERRMAETPVNLVGPEHATDYIPPERPAQPIEPTESTHGSIQRTP